MDKKGPTRREFLKIAADGVTTVNGTDHQHLVDTRDTLAKMLRNELHLTGTKVACDRSECGACTVLY